MDRLPSSRTWPIAPDDGSSLHERAFAAFNPDWIPSGSMLGLDIPCTFATPNTPENITFPIDDMLGQLTLDEAGGDDQGEILSFLNPDLFSSSPPSCGIGSFFTIDPPLTLGSSNFNADSFGASSGQVDPLSPSDLLAFNVDHTSHFLNRPTSRIPIQRTKAHINSEYFSSRLHRSTVHLPQPKPTLPMRAKSHSVANHSRPTDPTMSPRMLRSSTLDAALTPPDGGLQFQHVNATPFSSSAPFSLAPNVRQLGRTSTIQDEKALRTGEDDVLLNRETSLEQSADLVMFFLY
ncbi:hypothetical protein OPQ81_008420 [Rhizoctonia solani]|nr:hypothetical protein OPQ81_008420 [Rhizoctonia solani]